MEGIYGSEEIGVAERAAKFRNIHNVRLRLPHQLQSMYMARLPLSILLQFPSKCLLDSSETE